MYTVTLLRAAVISAALMGTAIAAEPGKPDANPATPVAANPPAAPQPSEKISVATATETPVRAQHKPANVKIYPCF
jgi:hypothetical protein